MQVWCLAINQEGTLLVSGSNDRSLRQWEQTDEPLYLEEERQKELEELLDGEEKGGRPSTQKMIGDREGSGIAPRQESGSVARGEADKYSLTSGEMLMEAIDLVSKGERKEKEGERRNRKEREIDSF